MMLCDKNHKSKQNSPDGTPRPIKRTTCLYGCNSNCSPYFYRSATLFLPVKISEIDCTCISILGAL